MHVVAVVLFRPQHSGQGLAHHVRAVGTQRGGNDRGVELIALLPAAVDHLIECVAEETILRARGARRRDGLRVRQPQAHDGGLAWTDGQPVVGCDEGPGLVRVHHVVPTVDDGVVDPIFDVGRLVRDAEEPLHVGLVLGEQQRHVPVAVEVARAQPRVDGTHDAAARAVLDLGEGRTRRVGMPRPLVAEPQPRQQVERGGIGSTVVDRAADQNIVRGGLGVLDEHVEVAVLVEHAGVEQLVLRLIPAPLVIRANQVVVRIGGLRILVQVAHVRVRGRGVEVEVGTP